MGPNPLSYEAIDRFAENRFPLHQRERVISLIGDADDSYIEAIYEKIKRKTKVK